MNNKRTLTAIFYVVFSIYFLLLFFLADSSQAVLCQRTAIAIAVISVVLFCLLRIREAKRSVIAIIFVLTAVFIGSYIQVNKNNMYMLNMYIYVFIIYLVYRQLEVQYESRGSVDVLALAMSVLLCVYLYQYRFLNVDFLFGLTAEENYVAAFVFLYFMYCFKKKQKYGVVLSIVLVFFVRSRMYPLAVLAFFCLRFLRKKISNVKKPHIMGCQRFAMENYFLLFLLMNLGIILLSLFWITNMRESGIWLDDYSNYMRFLANIHSITVLKENNLVFAGLGNNLQNVIVSMWSDTTHTAIQAHNSFLNTLLVMGIVPGTIYYFIIFQIAEKAGKDNFEYIVSYILYSLIMHSLLSSSFLLFWFFILYSDNSVDSDRDCILTV